MVEIQTFNPEAQDAELYERMVVLDAALDNIVRSGAGQ